MVPANKKMALCAAANVESKPKMRVFFFHGVQSRYDSSERDAEASVQRKGSLWTENR